MIRPATLDDLNALEQLEQHFPGDRLSRQSFRHLLTKGHADILVLEADGQLLASAVVLYRKGFLSARLYSLIVHPQARGRGYGSCLLAAAEAAAKARGCVSLRLEVREDNCAAQALYRKHGYECVGRTAEYYDDHSAALRLRKQLIPRRQAHQLKVPYYPQSLEFTCGPACLMMALRYHGYPKRFSQALELTLWREATTIFMLSGHGGTSAHGLALAARRRGFAATVIARDNSVPFLDSVRDPIKKSVIALSHQHFSRELKRLGGKQQIRDFGSAEVERALLKGYVPLVLLSGYRLYGEKVPHWCVVTGFDEAFLYLHDPYIPKGLSRADSIHLPLPKGDFERVSRYGKARHRYLVLIGPPDNG